MKKIYETPYMEEIEIKIQDVMAESVEGDRIITDDELFGPQN